MELQRDFYVGVVEDNIDPNRKGRIKIRVQTLYHSIPVSDIPYAYPFAGLAGKEFQVPAIGKLVNVLFLSDDLYSPYYIYSENYNPNLQNKLKYLNDEDYSNFSALLFDESTQIYVQRDELTIDQLLNKITINKKSINLELKDKEQTLALGSRKADQNAVLGTNFFDWMDKFINEIMNPSSMLDSSGAAISRPKLIKLCQDYKANRKDFISNYVKIINNDDLEKIKRYPGTVNNKNDIDLILPPEENPKNQQELISSIQEQNKKSCEELKKSAPTDKVALTQDTAYSTPQFYNNSMITVQSGIDKSQLLPVWHADSANRISTLHPKIRQYAIEFMNRCYAKGIKIIITEAFRTRQQQEALQKTGRAAKPGFSYHEYGLAIDISLTNSGDWDTVGEIGQGLGWRWGRFFRTPRREDWHFDMGMGYTTKDLKSRLEGGYLTAGYVELEGDMPKIDNQYSGQNYVAANTTTSISKPCSEMDDFNLKNDTAKKKNTNGTSDENEGAPSKKEEDSSKQTMACSVETILERVMKGEGTNQPSREDGAQSTYDITIAYGKWTPDLVPGTNKPTQPISALSIGEIKLVQEQMVKNGAISSAVGKYQLISDTLEVAQRVLKLDDSTIFSPEIQDRFGQYLLERRGYSKWMKGNLSDDDFQNNLAKEWASIGVAKDTVRKMKNGLESPVRSGESFYNQHVGTTKEEMKDTLTEAKNEKC